MDGFVSVDPVFRPSRLCGLITVLNKMLPRHTDFEDPPNATLFQWKEGVRQQPPTPDYLCSLETDDERFGADPK